MLRILNKYGGETLSRKERKKEKKQNKHIFEFTL